MRRFLALVVLFAAVQSVIRAGAAPVFEPLPGDHICIVGNTLADRMQHSGYFETLIQSRFPTNHLVFRDLGFSGDELTVRQRSEGFGSAEDWLKREKADVVFAFFGFNESFKGPGGLEQFRKDLAQFVSNTRDQNYGGKAKARVVLFSPIAQESAVDPAFPDPTTNNANLKLYRDAMAQVAREQNVPFVDLFAITEKIYHSEKTPLTSNGIHLTDRGYRLLAAPMFEALLGETAPSMKGTRFEKLLAAVNEKNAAFFKRYRTMDGYNVYGGRSYLKFDGVMNRDTMQREMQMRDVQTENRDQRVWAVAQGGDLVVDDKNLPAPIEVQTNKRGENPDGTFKFLGGEEAISRMKVPPGVKVNLFASEEKFPDLANPVQMAFDTKGRLWVACWLNYPERTPQSTRGDSLLVFEDTDGDGKADKVTPFADDLNCPTGFQFYKDGVLLVQAPDLWFLRDTDGDGRADSKERVLSGLDSADSHHTANALVIDPGGAIYLSDGVFHRSQVETARGPVRNIDAAIYRFEPRTAKFETYISYGFANPHGRVFDGWGNDLVTDATGNNTYFGAAFSGHIDYPKKHADFREFWNRPSRPCAGSGILSSPHFPEEFQGNFLNCNVIGFQGIYRVKVKEEGSGIWGETIEPALVQSDDPNFRPSAVDVAPDGSIYFLDWHNPIIGHMQHHLRDPNRDHAHGRVYRMTYEGRPLVKPAKIAGEPIEKLLDLLKDPQNNVRTRAKIELGSRDTKKVIAALEKWTRRLDEKKMEDQHAWMEALWVYQWHDVVNEPLLRQMLQSPEPHARAAAGRVLCYWRDRIRDPQSLAMALANDSSPRARLEAVRLASFLQGREAQELAYEILKQDTDYYLDYTLTETLRQVRKSPGDITLPKDPKARRAAVDRLSKEELAEAPGIPEVFSARVRRPASDLNARSMALDQLARVHERDRLSEIVDVLSGWESSENSPVVNDLGMLLASNTSSDLDKARPNLRRLLESPSEPVRRAAYAGLIVADSGPEKMWVETAGADTKRESLLGAMTLLSDSSLREKFQPLLAAALRDPAAGGGARAKLLQSLPLTGAENAAKNFELLSAYIRQRTEMNAAARALLQLPRDAWTRELAQADADAIVQWAKQVPADQRSSREFVETVQTGLELAGMLPEADATRVRKELLKLGVRVFVVKSVREQMRYDTTRIVVEAGKPFEIIFENTDFMPHNLVVVEPKAREEVGTMAQSMQPTPNRQGKVYVPNSRKIIASTKLVEPGNQERMKLTAPSTPGDYEYVCTYPEHWKVMYGQLVVVKDLESYAASAAAGEPAPIVPAGAEHSHQH
jgi:glucose/arabinose dehydrogenase/azurin